MAGVLAQILVELGLNTAAFKGGCDKATYMAKAAATEIKGTFSEIGSAFSEIGSSMGGLGGQIAGSLGSISKVLDPLLGSFKTLSGVGAGLAGSFVIAGAGAIATAIHFSETAAKAAELSHATGLSVEAISSLGNVAATRGVSMEALAHGLERMSRSALQAAKNPMAASNAYREFGIQIQDTSGKLLSADQILMNTADRFAEFEDGPQKTAAAIKIFGRAGAEMIDLLDLGGEHIQKMKKDFDDLGATISTSTGEGSVKLKENMTLMGAAFTGFENELTAALLPALNEVADEFITAFKGNQGYIQMAADGLAFVGKTLINVGQILFMFGKWFVDGFGLIEGVIDAVGKSIGALGGAMVNITHGDFKGASEGIREAFAGGLSQVVIDAKKTWQQIQADGVETMGNMWKVMNAKPEEPEKAQGKKELPNPMKDEDLSWMDRQVDQFNKAAERAEELSGKIGLLGSAEMEYAAHVKATTEIEKLRDEEHQKNEKLGKGATYETEAFKNKLLELAPALEAAALKEEVFNNALKAGEGLDKLNKELEKQAAHFRDDAEAMNPYQKEMAALQEKLVPAKEEIQALTDELGKTKDPATVRILIERIAALIAMTEKAKVTIADIGSAFQSNAISNVIKETTKEQEKLNASMSLEPEYITEARAEAARLTAGWTDVGKAAAFAAAMVKQATAKHDVKIDAQAADTVKAPVNEMADFEQQKKFLQENAAEWNKNSLSAAAYQKELQQITLKELELRAAAGSVSAGIKAGFLQMVLETKTVGQAIQENITKAFTQMNRAFAQSIVEGKNLGKAMKNVAKGIAEDMIEAGLKILEKWIITHLLMNTVAATSAATQAAEQIAANKLVGTSAAGLAGANAVASFSAAPWPIDMGAPAFGASMAAEAMTFNAFESGGIVPETGLAMMHEKEMVLPRPIAEKVQAMADPSANQGKMRRQTNVTMNITTKDANSFRYSQNQISSKQHLAAQKMAKRNGG